MLPGKIVLATKIFVSKADEGTTKKLYTVIKFSVKQTKLNLILVKLGLHELHLGKLPVTNK